MSATGRGGKRERLDRYYTPEVLARVLVGRLDICPGESICEPSAGGGAFARALRDLPDPGPITCVDVDPMAPGLDAGNHAAVSDFVHYKPAHRFDWIVGNPPYRHALAHVEHALTISDRVAFLLRLGFLESAKRAPFWELNPCRRIWALSERPSFTGGGTDATAYGFFYWDALYPGPTRLDVLSWKRGNPEPRPNAGGGNASPNREPDQVLAAAGFLDG